MDTLQIVACRLGDETYGIDIDSVREIIQYVHCLPVPRSAPFVEGLINVRGTVVPVVDMRRYLGIPDVTDMNTPIILVTVGKRTYGLIVDELVDVATHQVEMKESMDADTLLSEAVNEILKTQDGLLPLLDVTRLLSKKGEIHAALGEIRKHEAWQQARREFHDAADDEIRDRTARLAAVQRTDSIEEEAVVIFRIDKELFAVPAENVVEVFKGGEITTVPCAEPHVRGVLNLRGEIITIIDLSHMIGKGTTKGNGAQRAIVLRCQGISAALMVDEVIDLVLFPKASLEAPPSTLEREHSELLLGEFMLGQTMVSIVSATRILNIENVEVIEPESLAA